MYDAIVVGGSIGGAAVAYFLGGAGQQVLVLEKEALPRHKACGDGVPKSVFRRFPFPFDEVVESEIAAVRFSYSGRREVAFPLPANPVAVDPFWGEGIRYAVRSARLAAEAIAKDEVRAYTPGVQQEIGVGLRRARWLACLFYGLLYLCFLLGVRNPQMIHTFADMLDERASYFDISKHIPLALLGISSDAMRETRPAQGKVVGGSSEQTTAR